MNKYKLAKSIFEYKTGDHSPLYAKNRDYLSLNMTEFHEILEGTHDKSCTNTPSSCTKCEAEACVHMAEWLLEKTKEVRINEQNSNVDYDHNVNRLLAEFPTLNATITREASA